MSKRYYYYASYVVMGGTFGATEFDSNAKINSRNCFSILRKVIKGLEKDEKLKEIVILNFQELEKWIYL